jgi:hypothetical protein
MGNVSEKWREVVGLCLTSAALPLSLTCLDIAMERNEICARDVETGESGGVIKRNT